MHPTVGRGARAGRAAGPGQRVRAAHPDRALARPALGLRVPGDEVVRDVVVSAGYGVLGRWRERYEDADTDRADQLLDALGVRALAGAHVRHAVRGRAQADADRPGVDDRSRAAAARRAGRRAGPGRPRGPARRGSSTLAADPDAPASVLVTHHVEEIPRRLQPRAAAARGRGGRGRAARRRAHRREPDARRSGCRCLRAVAAGTRAWRADSRPRLRAAMDRRATSAARARVPP